MKTLLFLSFSAFFFCSALSVAKDSLDKANITNRQAQIDSIVTAATR